MVDQTPRARRIQVPITRRAMLTGTLGAAAGVGVGVASGLHGSAASALPGPSARGTTLDRTIVRGAAGTGGYARLTTAPGEPFLFRGELAGVPTHRARR